MASNRERPAREAVHRAKRKTDMQLHLETRRADMYAAEGHAGSIPRGEPLGGVASGIGCSATRAAERT